jgi:hypothetical protein
MGLTPDRQRSALRIAQHPGHAHGRKILPQRHQLPGQRTLRGAKNSSFIGFFTMARRLLMLWL